MILNKKEIIDLIKELMNASYYKGLCDGAYEQASHDIGISQNDIKNNYKEVKELYEKLLKELNG